jgi:hypothetical protein
VVVTSLVFSFPFSLVTLAYSLLTEEMVRGHDLALWITNSWRNIGALLALNWVVVFAFLKATKGIIVLSPKTIAASKRVLTGTLIFFTLADAGFFLLFSNFDRPKMVCSAVSPDGSIKATAGFHGFLDASWFIVLERNAVCPVFAVAAYGDDAPPHGANTMGKKMLAWSKDSQVVSLWFGPVPVSAYDRKEGRKWHLQSEAYRLNSLDNLSPVGTTNVLSVLLGEGFSAAKFLHNAVERGDVASATELIARGANVREKENDSTLLQVATGNRDLNMVRYLLKNGADANQTSYSWGHTALVTAARQVDDGVASELLAHGADVNAKLDNGITALMAAAQSGNQKVAQVLLDAGADVKATDKDGQTALFFAEKQKHQDVAKLLRGRQGAGLTPK